MFKVAAVTNLDSLKEARRILNTIQAENPSYWPYGLFPDAFDGGLYLIREKRSNMACGFCGWQDRFEKQAGRRIKVGYYSIGILPEFRGNHFAKEAVSKLIAYKAASVDQVRALIMAHNKPSMALAQSLGVPVQVKTASVPCRLTELSRLWPRSVLVG